MFTLQMWPMKKKKLEEGEEMARQQNADALIFVAYFKVSQLKITNSCCSLMQKYILHVLAVLLSDCNLDLVANQKIRKNFIKKKKQKTTPAGRKKL